MDDQEVRARVGAVERLLGEFEALPPVTRDRATQAVQAVAELYGEALERIMTHAAGTGASELLQAMADDELVSHLLLLHELHPTLTLVGEQLVPRPLPHPGPVVPNGGGDAWRPGLGTPLPMMPAARGAVG